MSRYRPSSMPPNGTTRPQCVNTLRPRQNGRHFADDILKCIFLNDNVWIPIEISLKFVPKGPIVNIPALVKIMAWRRSSDKPLSIPMIVRLPRHIFRLHIRVLPWVALAHGGENNGWVLICSLQNCIFLIGDSREVTHRFTSKFCDDKKDTLLYTM